MSRKVGMAVGGTASRIVPGTRATLPQSSEGRVEDYSSRIVEYAAHRSLLTNCGIDRTYVSC